MKFGKHYHQHIVPEWDHFYINYNAIKRLIKASRCLGKHADISDAYRRLGQNIDALEAFRRSKNAALVETHENLRIRFGLPSELTECRSLKDVDRDELLLLLNAYTDLQRELSKVQWFDRLNQDAVWRIFTKLERLGQGKTSLHSRHRTRWFMLQDALGSTFALNLDSLDLFVAELRRTVTEAKSGTGSSLFLVRALEQHSFNLSFRDALNLALRGGETDPVKILESIQQEQKTPHLSLQSLLHDVLEYSVLIRPNQLAVSLLSNPMFCNNSLLDRDLLNYLIIATGQKRLSAIDRSDSPCMETSYDKQISSLFARILECLGRDARKVLLTKDYMGRLPLHYAARYGLTEICQVILDVLIVSGNKAHAKQAALWRDKEGQTALQCAVIGNNVSTVKAIVEILAANSTVIRDHEVRVLLGDALLIALKYQNDAIVNYIIDRGANLSRRTSRREMALHIAAQIGRLDYAKRVLQDMSEQGFEVDVQEFTYGWTPLFTACVGGHTDIVKLLLDAGASQEFCDYLGWTAKEHAAFRGYLPMAQLFEPSKLTNLDDGPANPPETVVRNPQAPIRPAEKFMIVNLGSTQVGREASSVDLTFCSSIYDRDVHDGFSYELEISAAGSTWKPIRVRLPVLDDRINEPFVFPIDETAEAQLVLKVFRKRAPTRNVDKLIASGIALPERTQHCLGAQRQSMIKELVVAMLGQDTMDLVGNVTLTCLIAKSFPFLQVPQAECLKSENGVPTLVGHRGLGQNTASREYLQIGENTVESALSAAKLGAAFIEFGISPDTLINNQPLNQADVQITRDLEPVIYHDFSLSESGMDVPVHDLTIEQFKYAGSIQSPQGNPISALGKVQQHPFNGQGRHRSRSVGEDFEAGTVQTQDRMKHTVVYKDQGFKGNTRGSFIQDSLATLADLLVSVPEDIGFDIEIKYPRLHEAQAAGVATVAIELNAFIDAVLHKIERFGGGRRIFLSSFTPDVCILLSAKQRAYPVMFITNAGKIPMTDMEMRAASLQVAVKFAKRWNLAGVVFSCETLLLCPRLVRFVTKAGLVCASYGALNNEPANVKVQADVGVDMIVADRISLIAKTLKDV